MKICSSCVQVPVNVGKTASTTLITPYSLELKSFPPKASKKNIKKPKSSAGASKPSTGHKQPSKTTILSSVTDAKTLLKMTALQLTNISGTNTTTLALCDTACSNSWVFDSLAVRLGLQGTSLNLTVQGINKI